MYDDIEADYWKDCLISLIHKNMVKTEAHNLYFQDSKNVIQAFETEYPQWKGECHFSDSYASWEIFITDSIKLRLYIQSQIKITLLQKNDNDFIKLADGKIHNNPFPEIAELLSKKEQLEREVDELKKNNLKFQKQQKITGEIIKALLYKKLGKEAHFTLEFLKKDFLLTIFENNEEKKYALTMNNFKDEINNIQTK